MFAHEGPDARQHRPVELGRGRLLLDDPGVEVLVLLIQQGLELIQFLIAQRRAYLIGEGA
ncbi:hypothetical protein D3C81_1798990 [compost metagenome]